MENEITQKKSLFHKIVDFINGIHSGKRKKEEVKHSHFGYFLDSVEKDTEEYNAVENAVSLCDESLSIVSQRLMMIEKLKEIEEKIVEVESYNSLTAEEAEQLKDLLNRFSSLAKDKNALRYQVTGFDNSLVKMAELEEEAPAAINEIRYAEDKQKIFKQDMGYLEGEKSDLEYEQEKLVNGLDFIYKFSIALVLLFSTAAIFLVFLYIFRGTQTLVALATMIIMIAIITGLLYSLRIRMRHELQLNYKKQQRAVEMLNKKSVVYAHYTNFLNYEYKKFKVRNSDMLKNNLKDYAHYKHLTKRLDSIRSIMYQTEDAIEGFLRHKNITNISTTIEKFAQTIDVDDKKEYCRELLGEKTSIEKTLTTLDTKHEKIWDTLVMLNEEDKSEDKIIDNITKAYINEAGKLLSQPTKLNTTKDAQKSYQKDGIDNLADIV